MIHLIHSSFETAMNQMKAAKPSLVIADPPDNIGKLYDAVNDSINEEQYKEMFHEWILMCCQLTSGPVFFIPAETYVNEVEKAIERFNLKLVQRIIWFYTFGQHHTKRYGLCFRPIYWLNRDIIYPERIHIASARQEKYKDKRANSTGKMPPNVWEFSRVCGTFKERRKWHPCQLPEAMIKRIIEGHSNPGDIVCDPFVGSGTTALVADSCGRDFIGCDLSLQYLLNIKEELFKRNPNAKVEIYENTK